MARVIKEFSGAPDGEVYPRVFVPGDHVAGNLAVVAVREGWAEAEAVGESEAEAVGESEAEAVGESEESAASSHKGGRRKPRRAKS